MRLRMRRGQVGSLNEEQWAGRAKLVLRGRGHTLGECCHASQGNCRGPSHAVEGKPLESRKVGSHHDGYLVGAAVSPFQRDDPQIARTISPPETQRSRIASETRTATTGATEVHRALCGPEWQHIGSYEIASHIVPVRHVGRDLVYTPKK